MLRYKLAEDRRGALCFSDYVVCTSTKLQDNGAMNDTKSKYNERNNTYVVEGLSFIHGSKSGSDDVVVGMIMTSRRQRSLGSTSR